MAARPYPIRTDARRALTDAAAFAGPRVTITEQLGSPTWQQVKTVLEKLGAVYVIGSSAFEFEPDQDARAIVAAALDAGRVLGAANADGYVSTPAELAAHLVNWYGELRSQSGRKLRVLEPSAGVGRFVTAIREQLAAEWCHIDAVEMDARRARQIPVDESTTVHVETFEAFAERARTTGQRFDVVIMNPPFAVPGRAFLAFEHLALAWSLLAPGGRLVAILPASVLDANRSARAIRDAYALVREHGAGELLDRDAFAESGITYGTASVWLDRPLSDVKAPAPGAGTLPAFVSRPYTGDELAEPVARPYLTRGAALTTPVQLWYDGWRGTPRTLRYRGECVVCERPVWAFDDGENDPRGALGDAAPDLLDPAEHDHGEGLPVVACFCCMNDGRETYERAWKAAAAYWATVAAARSTAAVDQAEPATPFVSGWAQLSPSV